ncbi:MAG: sulfatase-like hydrolase/transferase [Pirellulaceae bacterium]|nr:sulfatase-like hydrolase/transferase [Pirellulaceae bacterium]
MNRIIPVLLACLGGVAQAADKPNVLMICVDDLKPALGCYGDKLAKSPSIDRLAARGVVFDRAYCNQAVCSPSRNALLTGLRSQTLGIYDLGTNFRMAKPDAITLPQHFKQNGYRTEAMGKIFHVGHGNHEDEASWSVPHWKANVVAYALPESKAPTGLTREEALFANKSAKDLPKGAPLEAADVPDNTYPDGALADEAIVRLQAAAKRPDQPFFMAVGFVKPHLPFVAPKKYWDMYDRKLMPLAEVRQPPVGAPSYAPQFGGELRQYRDIPDKGELNDDLQRHLIHGYYAAMSYMDAQVGRVVGELDRLGLDKNTIIVLWGDHGWHLGDHGMWCKHTNYEQATRIPVIVVAPQKLTAAVAKGSTTGVHSASLVESVDIYPTLCELAGLKMPQPLDGRSFVSTLGDPALPTKEYILHAYPRNPADVGPIIGRAVRTDRYRLVEWKKIGAPAETAQLELYDYEVDPLENQNQAAAQPEVVAKLRSILSKTPEAKPQISGATKNANGAAGPGQGGKPKQDRQAMFNKKDRDGNGRLTKEEFMNGQPDPDVAPARFKRFDVDQDGELTREEFVSGGTVK